MVLIDWFDDYFARESLCIIFGILGSQRDGLFVEQSCYFGRSESDRLDKNAVEVNDAL